MDIYIYVSSFCSLVSLLYAFCFIDSISISKLFSVYGFPEREAPTSVQISGVIY